MLSSDMSGIDLDDWRRQLAARIGDLVRARPRPLIVGLCGPQGSGKSTAAATIQALLQEQALRAAILSLDDLYLTRADRSRLAKEVHPLLATRGPPGTHDIPLGLQALADLGARGPTRVPRFDKAADDRMRVDDWPLVIANCDCILFEGWCVGARPQPASALVRPVNVLEAREDQQMTWRTYVNEALAGPYQRLFDRIDYLALLRPPAFDHVLAWRTQQEHELHAQRSGPGLMSDADLVRFIQHYERLSRWIDMEMPGRADAVIELDADRGLRAMSFA
jgi:D-glycerate 3-kinase